MSICICCCKQLFAVVAVVAVVVVFAVVFAAFPEAFFISHTV